MYRHTWFTEGKYGLFIHFGLFSILAGEFEGKRTRGLSEWILLNDKVPEEAYNQLVDTFDPVLFDAKYIAQKAKAWGMKYICFTSKHHDGFALFDSKVDSYNSVASSPSGRDFVRELADACAEEDLVLCLYYSQAQDWHHPDGYWAYRDNSQKNFRHYLDEKCIPQLREILSNYGRIGMVWFDTPLGMTMEESKELVELVKSLQPDCLINGRIGNDLGDYLTTQDNRIPSYPIKKMWEVPGTLNSSWGYKYFDENWYPPEMVLNRFLNIVSRGGNYLLNIGPRGDGSIPEASVEILDAIGAWLSLAGESIYGTQAIENYVYEAPEIRFTHRDYHLYIHVLNPRDFLGKEIPIPNLANTVKSVRWLNGPGEGHVDPLRVTRTLEGDPYWGLHIPEQLDNDWILTLDVETNEQAFLQKKLDE